MISKNQFRILGFFVHIKIEVQIKSKIQIQVLDTQGRISASSNDGGSLKDATHVLSPSSPLVPPRKYLTPNIFQNISHQIYFLRPSFVNQVYVHMCCHHLRLLFPLANISHQIYFKISLTKYIFLGQVLLTKYMCTCAVTIFAPCYPWKISQ